MFCPILEPIYTLLGLFAPYTRFYAGLCILSDLGRHGEKSAEEFHTVTWRSLLLSNKTSAEPLSETPSASAEAEICTYTEGYNLINRHHVVDAGD